MLILIDNYDSFTYNLVQYFGILGAVPRVFRNDEVTLDELEELQPTHLVISPGPKNPAAAGISCAAIERFAGRVPVLGVCLGHQCIAEIFGGRVVRAREPVHGKTSLVHHDSRSLFRGLPNPLRATRYHSLTVAAVPLPSCLEVSAYATDGHIMGLRHRELAVEGVQFHPEAILTQRGLDLLRNFLALSRGRWA